MSITVPADRKTARRLDGFRRLLTHIHERILPDLGFVLWDGSTVPADLRADALAFVIADEGAVAAMMRRPNVDTFLNLWVTSRFDLRNGTFFDLAARRPTTRTRTLMKSFDKRLALTALARFLFVPRGGPWPLEAVRSDKARSDGSEAANNNCLACHSADMVLNQPPMAPPAWLGVVRKMARVYKAPVDEDDAAAVLDYLTRTRGAN